MTVGLATQAVTNAVIDYSKNKKSIKNENYKTQLQAQLNEGEGFPPNQGAVPGTEMEIWIEQGQKLDRYGRTTEGSRYLSPVGTDYPSRSLNLHGEIDYEIYEVTKPFVAESSLILPWYGQPGMGYQIKTFVPIKTLMREGYLNKIKTMKINF